MPMTIAAILADEKSSKHLDGVLELLNPKAQVVR